MGTAHKYQVFVSSTKEDLSDAREEITWCLLKAQFIPVGMENFSATHDRGWKVIARMIDESDYYVVVVAGRYGSIEAETDKSWTQREYEYAIEKKLHVLAFVRALSDVTGDQLDEGEKRERLNAFKDDLKRAHLVESWTTVEDLCTKIATALPKAVQENAAEGTPRAGWYRGPAPSLDEFAALSREVRELREQLVRASQRSTPLEFLKTVASGTPIQVTWRQRIGGGSSTTHHLFGAIDEARNVIRLQASGAYSAASVPLDKLDTAFPDKDDKCNIIVLPL
jgi:hypothetical protein